MTITELKKPESPIENTRKWIDYWKNMNKKLGYNHFKEQLIELKEEMLENMNYCDNAVYDENDNEIMCGDLGVYNEIYCEKHKEDLELIKEIDEIIDTQFSPNKNNIQQNKNNLIPNGTRMIKTEKTGSADSGSYNSEEKKG